MSLILAAVDKIQNKVGELGAQYELMHCTGSWTFLRLPWLVIDESQLHEGSVSNKRRTSNEPRYLE